MKFLNGKYKIRNRIMAAFLAVTMLLTLVPTGQMQVYAAGEGKVNVDSFTVKVNGVVVAETKLYFDSLNKKPKATK